MWSIVIACSRTKYLIIGARFTSIHHLIAYFQYLIPYVPIVIAFVENTPHCVDKGLLGERVTEIITIYQNSLATY